MAERAGNTHTPRLPTQRQWNRQARTSPGKRQYTPYRADILKIYYMYVCCSPTPLSPGGSLPLSQPPTFTASHFHSLAVLLSHSRCLLRYVHCILEVVLVVLVVKGCRRLYQVGENPHIGRTVKTATTVLNHPHNPATHPTRPTNHTTAPTTPNPRPYIKVSPRK